MRYQVELTDGRRKRRPFCVLGPHSNRREHAARRVRPFLNREGSFPNAEEGLPPIASRRQPIVQPLPLLEASFSRTVIRCMQEDQRRSAATGKCAALTPIVAVFPMTR